MLSLNLTKQKRVPTMTNAWALAASILDGTFDEDYPIMNKEDTTITPLESDEYDPIKTSEFKV